MNRLAPDIAIEGHVLGEDTPLRVELRRPRRRWTVVVFESAVEGRRLYELASLRNRFEAEDADLLVISDVPAQWAEQRVHTAYDRDGRIRDAFGARDRTCFVVGPGGVLHHAGIAPQPEQDALDYIAGVRMGTVLPASIVAEPLARAA